MHTVHLVAVLVEVVRNLVVVVRSIAAVEEVLVVAELAQRSLIHQKTFQ